MENNPVSAQVSTESNPSVQASPSQQLSSYGKKNWSKWILIYFVSAIIIFLTTVIILRIIKPIYNLTKVIETPLPTTIPPFLTPAPNPTANWKTYTNSKYGYVLKYPTNWSLVEQLSGAYADLYDQPNITQPQLHDGSWVIINISAASREGNVKISDPIGTRKEFANKVYEQKIADITLDTYPAAKMVLDILPGNQTDSRPTTSIVTNMGSDTLVIAFSNPDRQQYEKDLKIFDQILSTFKFINN